MLHLSKAGQPWQFPGQPVQFPSQPGHCPGLLTPSDGPGYFALDFKRPMSFMLINTSKLVLHCCK